MAALTPERAEALARLPLAGIQREYPHGMLHLLLGPDDVLPPRELHPAFYGCYDWHSAVHGNWTLVRLMRFFSLRCEEEASRRIDENLSVANIGIETAYFGKRPAFERMYGWAWLLKLCQELHEWPDPRAQRWRSNLQSLEAKIVELVGSFLPRQTYPIRVGTHGNTAYALGMILDYARSVDNSRLGELVCRRAMEYFQRDHGAPVRWEPGGNDFLSPSLIEADLMRRVIEPSLFQAWLSEFLPDLGPLREPAEVSDRSDPQIGHLDGLNLSRAWCLRAIAAACPMREELAIAAEKHAEAGLAHVTTGYYEGEHWLATFAVYLETEAWKG